VWVVLLFVSISSAPTTTIVAFPTSTCGIPSLAILIRLEGPCCSTERSAAKVGEFLQSATMRVNINIKAILRCDTIVGWYSSPRQHQKLSVRCRSLLQRSKRVREGREIHLVRVRYCTNSPLNFKSSQTIPNIARQALPYFQLASLAQARSCI